MFWESLEQLYQKLKIGLFKCSLFGLLLDFSLTLGLNIPSPDEILFKIYMYIYIYKHIYVMLLFFNCNMFPYNYSDILTVKFSFCLFFLYFSSSSLLDTPFFPIPLIKSFVSCYSFLCHFPTPLPWLITFYIPGFCSYSRICTHI